MFILLGQHISRSQAQPLDGGFSHHKISPAPADFITQIDLSSSSLQIDIDTIMILVIVRIILIQFTVLGCVWEMVSINVSKIFEIFPPNT